MADNGSRNPWSTGALALLVLIAVIAIGGPTAERLSGRTGVIESYAADVAVGFFLLLMITIPVWIVIGVGAWRRSRREARELRPNGPKRS